MSDAKAPVYQTEGQYRASDGASLHSYRWSSRDTESDPKAVIAIMHGYGEHCGRYREFAEFLVRAGYLACGIDARGHGQSEGQRGHIARYERYVDDLHGFTLEQRRYHPNTPFVLVGHSNGGLICLRTVQTRRPIPDALVLTSPLVALQPAHQPVPRWVAVALASFASRLPLPNGLDRDELTHDRAILEKHRHDKLNHGRSTPGWYVAATGAMQEAFANLDSVRLPVLVLEAERDPIVVPQAVSRLFDGIASSDKELVVCADAFHEVLNEVSREDTYRRILVWLDEHLTTQVAA
jgi:alpha-beta hydrolase superfamily lysophospholipase